MTTDTPAAGRELDTEVAEIVCGFRWWNRKGRNFLFKDTPEEFLELRPGRTETDRPPMNTAPYYSTDIAAAFQVVAEMERRGFWCEMRTPFMEPGGRDGYWCGFTPHGTSGWNGTPDHWTSAPTLTEAICRAALACVKEADA